MLHIYVERMQPATSFIDTHGGEPVQMGFPPEKLLRAQCCGKRRRAESCLVQVNYDRISVWCAPGQGCKHPEVISEKKARAFANRSAGQKKRWDQKAKKA